MGSIAIIADIGGTNARFAALRNDGAIEDQVNYKVADEPNLVGALMHYRERHTRDVDSVAISAAGPVLDVGGILRVQFTNSPQANGRKIAPWVCDQGEIAKALDLPLGDVVVVNDFQAAAYAVTTLRPEDFSAVHKAEASSQYPSLIVGPGSGLGIGRLTPKKEGGAVAWATEGGHGIAAVANGRQQEIVDALRTVYPQRPWFTNEDLYCFGKGLPNLHAANRMLAGENGVSQENLAKPEDITAGARRGDAVCLGAVNDFCFGLGVMAGHKALDPLSYGGIYLMGPYQKLGDIFETSLFLKGMESNDQPHLIRLMPIQHVTAETPAFNGLRQVLGRQQQHAVPA